MEIFSWNVNGIRGCLRNGFMNFLEHRNPDIMCCQETKTSPKFKMKTPGYFQYWNHAERAGYAGTMVLTRNLVDCNYDHTNQIKYYSVTIGKSGWPKSYCVVFRAKNYDAVNGNNSGNAIPTTSTPTDTDNKSSTSKSTTYAACNVQIACVNGQIVNLYKNPGSPIMRSIS